MNLPKKAIVLAAGFGTRLRPMTLRRPKPLLPVQGVPMLERILAMLEDWGVEEIAVNAHWLAPQIEDYAARRKGKARLVVSVEPEILGTGGALRPLAGFIGADPFWLVNGDIVLEDADPVQIANAFRESGGFAGCLLSETYGPRTVEADPEGRVCNWKSDEAGYPGTYTYCGCAVLSPEVAKYLPDEKCCSIVQAYEKAMMTDARFVVGSIQPDAVWSDAGTLDAYREVNDEPQDISLFGHEGLNSVVPDIGWKLGETGAEFLCTRGSDRSFWRLWNNGRRAIAIDYDSASRPENARYGACAKILESAGVPVPGILADRPGILVMEDLGDDSLEKRAKAKGVDMVKLYTPVVEALARMHEKGADAAGDSELEASFGPDLFKWERDLFEEHCVKGRFGFDGLPDDVREELEGVAMELSRKRPVLVHRDFQSSNVLYRGDKPVFIDFQGMRLGPAAYDLASLLYDPYVDLSDKDRKALASVYAAAAGEPLEELQLAAVQRLVQALGAFGRLASVGKPEFARHTLRALGNLLSAADDADLDAVGGFAEELISRETTIQDPCSAWTHHHHDHDDDHDGER